nr:hypothetical protein [Candidatus Sigynarchaeota archaeon]
MSQINIRVDKDQDELFEYLSGRQNLPKAVYVKQLLLENLQEKILPILLKDFESGKIGIKKILRLTGISPRELLEIIARSDIECPITPEIDNYTASVADEIAEKMKVQKSFDPVIPESLKNTKKR